MYGDSTAVAVLLLYPLQFVDVQINLNPFRTAVPVWVQTIQIPSDMSP